MDEATASKQLRKMEKASEDLTERKAKQLSRNDFYGECRDAIVTDFTMDEEELEGSDIILFELRMPSGDTRYLSFTDDKLGDEVGSNDLEEFLEELGTTTQEMAVLGERVPSVYTKEGWRIIYKDFRDRSAYTDGSDWYYIDKRGKLSFTSRFPKLAMVPGVISLLTIPFVHFIFSAMVWFIVISTVICLAVVREERNISVACRKLEPVLEEYPSED